MCASSTPPTGTSAGPSTGRACSAHQAAYVDHLLDVVERERVDLVVVAGDVYDRALPHVDAVAPGRRGARPAGRVAGRRSCVTSGNHDSAQRLGFGSRLIDAAGVFIRTDAATVGTPGPARGRARPGRRLRPPLPRPRRALASRGGSPAPLPRGGARPRRCAGSAPTSPAAPARTRSVVLAHAFVAGAEPSDSERDISVGGVSLVPTSVVRRHRLRRPRPPARPAHAHRRDPLQRLPAGLLLLRGRPPQGLLAGRPRRRRPGRAPSSSTRRSPGRWPGSAATLEDLLADPAPRRCTRTPGSRPRSPTTPARRRRWTGCARRFPHTLVLGFEPAGRRPVRDARRPRRTGRSDHDIALDFVADAARARRPPPAEAGAAARAPSTPAATTPTSTCSWPPDGGPMRLHHLEVTAFGPFADTVAVDFDAPVRRRAVPAHRRHRRRQDQRPRRRLLRAVRRRARRPQRRQAAALRPGRPGRRARA